MFNYWGPLAAHYSQLWKSLTINKARIGHLSLCLSVRSSWHIQSKYSKTHRGGGVYRNQTKKQMISAKYLDKALCIKNNKNIYTSCVIRFSWLYFLGGERSPSNKNNFPWLIMSQQIIFFWSVFFNFLLIFFLPLLSNSQLVLHFL